MLKTISVSNLGCFDDGPYTVDFSEETLLAGPNNSGKSMLLSALNLARLNLIQHGTQWDNEFFSLHDFEAAVNDHNLDKMIKVSFTLEENNKSYLFGFTCNKQGPRVSMFKNIIPAVEPEHANLLKKIWCLRPNRSPVPYTAAVKHAEGPFQPLSPSGSNVINYLLERWTDRDKRWSLAEKWLSKIDPDMSELKTPIRGSQVSLETMFGEIDVNVSLQGSGFQSAAAIISAIVFSPKGSTLIIEEPEAFLHPQSQEIIVDMINDAVSNQGKQVIFSTHSFNILSPFYNDCGRAPQRVRRGAEHIRADTTKFRIWTFEKTSGKIRIMPYPIQEKTFQHFKEDFKCVWG